MPERRISRRNVVRLGAAGGVVAAGGIFLPRLLDTTSAVTPGSRAVQAAETARTSTGRVVTKALTAAPAEIDLGGRIVQTAAFNGTIPGPELRVSAGDRLRVTLTNDLPATTTVHWHGLALRNDMDGVPGLTQAAIQPAADFSYDFLVPDPGTYWFHPHVGVQLDTGLYAPLIVEDPAEPGAYDDEVVLVLDDWTDGWGPTPDQILADFRSNGMGSMGDMSTMAGPSDAAPLGEDTGDVEYPAHLINGKLPESPFTVTAKPGQRLRLRIINAGADTAFRFAVGGHQMTVTHTDGFPVTPVQVDTLIVGMGERYDVLIDVQDGAFPIAAEPEGKSGPGGRAVLRSSSSASVAAAARPPELDGRLLSYDDLTASDDVAVGSRSPDRELSMSLTMGDEGRQWLINDQTYDETEPLEVRMGERVRLTMTNDSTMFHPMHLHGHTFAAANSTGNGVRKDTINVLPKTTLVVDFDAVNPGQWLTHCHNAYHGELGMMTVVSYVT